MKSLQDFETEAQYKDYLRTYYAGLVLQAIADTESSNRQRTQQDNAKNATQTALLFADELINALITEKK